jgi:hypothetical protein
VPHPLSLARRMRRSETVKALITSGGRLAV